MARKMKIDTDLLNSARDENRAYNRENPGATNAGAETVQTSGATAQQDDPPVMDKAANQSGKAEEKTNTSGSQGADTMPPPPQGPDPAVGSDDFKEKFDEYFKGVGSIIAGSALVELIDDFKTKALYIYAKKQKVDIPMEALKMDPKSKEFTSFLVDYAIKNKLFGWIQKYPLIAATGVMAISGASTFMLIEMMKSGKDENEALKKEVADLKRRASDKAREEAEEVEAEESGQEGKQDYVINDFIRKV